MEQESFLNIEQVAEEFKIPVSTIYTKANPNKTPKEHLLPSYKPAKTLLFKRSEVIRWIEKHKLIAS